MAVPSIPERGGHRVEHSSVRDERSVLPRHIAGLIGTEIDDATLLSFLRRFGRNTNAFLLTYGGYSWFVSESPTGLVGYVQSGRTAVVAGDPLCEPGDAAEVMQAFARALGPGWRVAMILASHWLIPQLRAAGYGAIQVGSDAVFDLSVWAPRGNRAKKVRNPVNRARRAGVTISTYRPRATRDPAIEAMMGRCAESWLKTRRSAQMHFLSELQPLTHAVERRYFLAWHDQSLVGFVTCSPLYARQGWYIEDIIREPDGPYGVTELLITIALANLRDEGATTATLGIAPFREQRGRVMGWRWVNL